MKNLSKSLAIIMTLGISGVAAFGAFGSTNDGGQGSDFDFDNTVEAPNEPEEIIINLTNTKTDETVIVKGTKTWEDKENAYGIRPDSITISLYADGEDTGIDATASEETEWTYEFEEQPKYDEDGSLIEYTVKETFIKGYTVFYDEPIIESN